MSLAAGLLLAGCASGGSRQAAEVNGVSIPVSRLTEMVQAQLSAAQQQQDQQQQQQQQQEALPDIEGLTRQSLEGLIQFQLILDGAKREGVTVEEGMVDARVQRVKDQATAQGAKFEDLLASNNLTEGLLRQQFRVQLALDLLATKLVPFRSDAELLRTLGKRKNDFVQIHVRHVLARDQDTAAKARDELLSSHDWKAVAKRYSIDPGSKDRGGDLSFQSKGQTVAQFEKAAFGLANEGTCKGKSTGSCASPISAPVRSQFGFHVIQVIGLRQPPLTNELRNQLDPTVRQRRDAAIDRWFGDQLRGANVTINPRFGRWDAASGKVVERATAPASPNPSGVPGASGQPAPAPGQP